MESPDPSLGLEAVVRGSCSNLLLITYDSALLQESARLNPLQPPSVHVRWLKRTFQGALAPGCTPVGMW